MFRLARFLDWGAQQKESAVLDFARVQQELDTTGRSVIPRAFRPAFIEACAKTAQQAFDEANQSGGPKSGFSMDQMGITNIPGQGKKLFTRLVEEYRKSPLSGLMHHLCDGAFHVLETYAVIRRLTNEQRRIAGLHYDYHTAPLLANALGAPRSVTHWVPLVDTGPDCPGLLIFDRDVTMQDIHHAAGEEGYIDRIDCIGEFQKNSVFSQFPELARYLKPEDAPHILDSFNKCTLKPGRDFSELRAIYARCMARLLENLRGRYDIPGLKRGDVLVFDSEVYHCSWFPDHLFKPRLSMDFRVTGDYADNDATRMFKSVRIDTPGVRSIEPAA